MAFAWLVAKAAWKPVRVRYKERIISLERGQLVVSQRDMGRALERTKDWAERFLRRCENEAMIATAPRQQLAIITICNYDKYQAVPDAVAAVTAAPTAAAPRQLRGTEQRREEYKEVSSVSKDTSLRSWKLPVGVSPQVWADFLANRKRKRLSNTETAWKAFNDDLSRVSAQTGIPPPKLIEICSARGWGGIYEPNKDNRHERTHADPTTEALNRILGSANG